jgi:Ca2+-binding EF-hand superfamily protein
MRTRKLSSLGLVLLICIGTAGLASQKDAIKTERFRKLDLNHDGKLSLTELRNPSAKLSTKREKNLVSDFQSKDKNDDGYLSLAEFKTMRI